MVKSTLCCRKSFYCPVAMGLAYLIKDPVRTNLCYIARAGGGFFSTSYLPTLLTQNLSNT